MLIDQPKDVSVVKLYDLDTPGHGVDRLWFERAGTSLWVHFQLSDVAVEKRCIRFFGTQLVHFRTEPFSTGFISESYDCLCECVESQWLADLDKRTIKSRLHFYVLYFSNCGYLEVAAEDYEVSTIE